MLGFLYSLLLKLLYPTSIALILLVASAVLSRRRPRLSRWFFWIGIATILVCGNGWLVSGLTMHLERRYVAPVPLPKADCILVLSGGISAKLPPRPTVEVGDAGDRLLYGAFLYRNNMAPTIICTGGVATGGIALRSAAEEMNELLLTLGVPQEAIINETKSSNTHEHARNLYPLFLGNEYKRILLVTSAMHMPRSLSTFRRLCPEVEFVPAPTDFRATDVPPQPWYRHLMKLIPTPSRLAAFCEVSHEYIGIVWYRLRGWL